MKREKYAVFTIDVEDFADTECVAKSGQRVRRHMLDGLDIYIRLLEQYQIRATMFAVCRTALREQERVQRYVDRGHRLALHGLEHVPPCGMDDEHFRRATLAGKQQLEAAFHTQVSGYRAPCFGLDEEKLDIVRQLGFRYDSSRMDFPAARHVKHLDMTSYRELRPGIYRKGEFYEFSLSCQRLFGQNYPISGGGYVRLSNWSFVLPLLRSYLREQDYYVFYLHPFELSRQHQPELAGLKLYDQYYLHRGLLTYRRRVEDIIRLLRAHGYRFVTFDELAERIENKPERK